MQTQNKRKVWQTPWGYPESIAIVVGVMVIGATLQLTIGSFNFFILANPVNYITGLVILSLSITFGIYYKRNSFARWISSLPLSVALIIATLSLTLIMGLTPQVPEGNENYTALGFESMTRNWSFVLVYALTLISLGSVVIRRVCHFRVKDIPFMLQHIGLWLFLSASALGYADMERYIMYVSEGETQWRVYGADNTVKELPIAITLNDFDMDVYPPKLALIERSTGEVQPAGRAQYFQIDQDIKRGAVAGWDIEVQEYIHKAVRGADSSYREVPMPGASPAIKIKASNGEIQREGWICGGNSMQSYMSLQLDDDFAIVMTPAEPRKFVSDVEVYTKDGATAAAQIEVNHPLKIGSWQIYQYGYDNAAGALSEYSSFELVYDAWLSPVIAGIVLMMLGALSMILQGRNRIITKRVR